MAWRIKKSRIGRWYRRARRRAKRAMIRIFGKLFDAHGKEIILDLASTDDPGEVGFTHPAYFAAEDQREVVVGVRRTNGAKGEVQADFEVIDGTAKLGEDYGLIYGELKKARNTWLDGDQHVRLYSIPILRRTDRFENTSFTVKLTPVTQGLKLQGSATAEVTIVRTGLSLIQMPGTFVPSIVVDPGTGTTTVDVWLTRLRSTKGSVAVDYRTVEGSAVPNVDYVPISGTLVWGDGDGTPKKVTVTIIGRVGDQGERAFDVEFFNLRGASFTYAGAPQNETDLEEISRTVVIKDTGSPDVQMPGPEPETWLDEGLVTSWGEIQLEMEQVIGYGEDIIVAHYATQVIGGRVGWNGATASYGGAADFTNEQSFGSVGRKTVDARILI